MRKKLFAILMSAMMMVTFMPMMAFAAETPVVTWGDKYAELTATYAGQTYVAKATRTEVQKDSKWNGLIHATADVDGMAADYTSVPVVVVNAMKAKKDAYFYDVNGAVVQYSGGALPTNIDKEYFAGIFTDAPSGADATYAITGLKLVAPSYVEGYAKLADVNKSVVVTKFNNWSYEFKTPSNFDEDSYDEQSFTVPVLFSANDASEVGSWKTPDLFGSVSKDLKVMKSTAKPGEARFYVDGDKEMPVNGNIGGVYDGAEHQIVMKELPGITPKYEALNATTGKYEVVDKLSFKNVGLYKFRVSATDGTNTTTPVPFTVEVEDAEVLFQFVPAAGLKVTTGIEYDPYDFIEVVGEYGTEGPAAKAAAAAVKADNATLKAWFKEVYDVTATPVKYDSTHVDLAIVAKKLTSAEEKAIATKYADLLKNFDIDVVTGTDAAAKLEVTNGANLHNEVEFVSAPTSKTYKAKKLKKAAKSFTVKAEALSGATVSYKLINANSKIKIDKASGKITLKKGLKKGTYKIKVKAWVNAGKGYAAADETQNITIKVK